MNRSKFDIAYKKWLEQLDEKVDHSLWKNIEDELDFMETWDHIESELDRQMPVRSNRRRMIAYLSVAASLAALLLLILGLPEFLQEPTHQPDGQPQQEIALQYTFDEEIELIPLDPPSKLKTGFLERDDRRGRNPAGDTNASGIFVWEDESNFPERLSPDNEIVFLPDDRLSSSSLEFKMSDPSVSLQSVSEKGTILPEVEKNELPDQRNSFVSLADVGMVYGYKNTWLINHETMNGLRPDKLGRTLLTFHRDMGVSTTWAVNGQPVLGLEFMWNSENGQKYQQYINARFVEREIELDYMRLQAMYIHDFNWFPGQALMGGYAGKLKVGREYRGDERLNVTPQYSDLDYGLVFGYQMNVPLHDRIMLKPGIRGTYNLVNIFRGDGNVPVHFKETRNLTTGFSLAFSYRLH